MIHGEADPIPIDAARAAAGLIGAQFHPLPRCGHVPYVEAFEEFRDLVGGFLRPPGSALGPSGRPHRSPDPSSPPPPPTALSSGMARPTPFDLVFAHTAETVFPAIRSLARGRRSRPRRPRRVSDGARSGVAAPRPAARRRGWARGWISWWRWCTTPTCCGTRAALTLAIPAERLAALLEPAPPPLDSGEPPRAYYAQLLEPPGVGPGDRGRRGRADGRMLRPAAGGELRVLGIFGLRPDRDGFSAVETAGPRPARRSAARRHAALLAGARGRRGGRAALAGRRARSCSSSAGGRGRWRAT